ncbi:hypothetical protein V1524DRAFT_436737 [Lipomyces starkeyi]
MGLTVSCAAEKQVVAKFFNPLFVTVKKLPADDAPARFRQIVTLRCCEHEVAANTALSSVQGSRVPIFYGGFACQFANRPAESDQTVKVILMEYIDGWPLSWYSPGELDESQADWKREMKEVLYQIHSCGVIHGDLDLCNFLLTKQRRLLLVDFEQSEILNGNNEFPPDVLREDDVVALRCELEHLGWLRHKDW